MVRGCSLHRAPLHGCVRVCGHLRVGLITPGVMAIMERDTQPGSLIYQYQHSPVFQSIDTSLAFPNLFLIIIPADWTFPMHGRLSGYYPDEALDVSGAATIHMYYLPALPRGLGVRAAWGGLGLSGALARRIPWSS